MQKAKKTIKKFRKTSFPTAVQKTFFYLTLFCALSFVANAYAATYTVNKTGSGDYTTIQAAVNVAKAGDIINVETGDYTAEGRISFPKGVSGQQGSLITIKSSPRRSATVAGFIMRYTGTDDIAASYLRIEGFNITNDGSDSWPGGIVIWGHGTEVVDNYIYGIKGPAIRSSNQLPLNENAYIANNYIYGCNKGLEFYGKGWLIEHNDIERLVRPESGGYDADYMRAFGYNNTIRYNYCHGTNLSEVGTSHTDGMQTWGESSGGIGLHDSVIENNVYQNFHQGIQIRNDATAASNLIIRNNVFDNRGWDSVGIGVNVGGGENIIAANNLIIGIHFGMRFRNDSNPDGVSGAIRNNIFHGCYLPLVFDDDPVTLGNNLYFNYSREPIKSGTDVFDGDPLLVNLNNIIGKDGIPFTSDDGYIISSSASAAINKGTNLSGVVDEDILGSKRPSQGTWDIGPMEYVPASGDLVEVPIPENLIVSGSDNSGN